MFGFNLIINISDIISIVLLIIACIGIYLTVRQLRQSYEVQKATFFKDLYLFAISDTPERAGFYLVIHNKFIFDANFKDSETELNIDALLCFFDMVTGLHKAGMITKQEISIFDYAFRLVYSNSQIQAYLAYLRKAFERSGTKTAPFDSFTLYCQKELAMD